MIYNLAHNGNKLITFTIDGTTYQAMNGMTWGEWVDSEYSSSVQNFQCPSCGVTEYFGKHNFHFTSASYNIGIGWVSPSAGCEASIYTNEFDAPEPVLSSLRITAGANYTIRTFCND